MSSIHVVFGMFVKATEENRKRTLDDWAELAQMKNPKRIPEEVWPSGFDNMDNLYGKWTVADLLSYCCLEDYGDYLCFEIFTNWWDVHNYGLPPLEGTAAEVDAQRQREIPLEEDPRVRISDAFAKACVALEAEAGLYATTPMYKPSYREIQEWLKEQIYEQAIRTQDAKALFDANWKILYLSRKWYRELLRLKQPIWSEELMWIDMPPPPDGSGYYGLLLFGQKGRKRF